MTDWNERLQHDLEELRGARDELKLQVHLGKMDAQERFEKAEKDWEHLEAVMMDLKSGLVRVRFDPSYASRQNWLRGARVLEGRWTDRYQIEASALDLPPTE